MEWILNDTYPTGVRRQQTPYLYHVPTRKRHDLGHFHSPKNTPANGVATRTRARANDGKLVTIDSPHGGIGTPDLAPRHPRHHRLRRPAGPARSGGTVPESRLLVGSAVRRVASSRFLT